MLTIDTAPAPDRPPISASPMPTPDRRQSGGPHPSQPGRGRQPPTRVVRFCSARLVDVQRPPLTVIVSQWSGGSNRGCDAQTGGSRMGPVGGGSLCPAAVSRGGISSVQ